MANHFFTLEKAKNDIKRLQYIVNLVESYEPINLEQEIIKEYAKTSSINEVSRRLNVSYEKVVDVITDKGKDELHKLVRSVYMKKTRHKRSYSY